MAEPRHTQPPDDLEHGLQDLGRHLDWPAEPNLLSGIEQRLAAQPQRRPRRSRIWSDAARPRLAWASIALALLVTLVLTVSDGMRSTVADRLGLPGVSISTDPTATLTPGDALAIGEQTTLDDAVSRSDGDLVMPPDTVLGPPDEVFVLDQNGTVQITYVYSPRVKLPEVGNTGVGLLISQFDGTTNDSFVQKQLGPDTTIELALVNGQPAYWLAGEPHVFYYERPDGDIYEETIRLAANVLLWEQVGKTLRIETNLALEDAVRIAEAMIAAQ